MYVVTKFNFLGGKCSQHCIDLRLNFHDSLTFAVAFGQRRDCQYSNHLKLTSQTGYVSSVMAEEHGLGTVHCPWIIQVKEGQRINITLYNFINGASGNLSQFHGTK